MINSQNSLQTTKRVAKGFKNLLPTAQLKKGGSIYRIGLVARWGFWGVPKLRHCFIFYLFLLSRLNSLSLLLKSSTSKFWLSHYQFARVEHPHGFLLIVLVSLILRKFGL